MSPDTYVHPGTFSADTLTARYPEPVFPPEGDALFVAVRGSAVCAPAGVSPQVFLQAVPAGCPVKRTVYLGHRGSAPCYAVELAAESLLPEGMDACGVRDLYGRIPEDDLAVAALAVRIVEYDRTTQYCGRSRPSGRSFALPATGSSTRGCRPPSSFS